MKRATVFLTHTPRDLELFFDSSALDRLREFAQVRLNPDPHRLSSAELCRRGTDCDVIVSEWQTGADAAVLSLPRLRSFVRAGVEVLNVDLSAASAHAVLVVNTPGQYSTSVAEYTMGLIISLARKIPAFHHAVTGGSIVESFHYAAWRGTVDGDAGFELAGETLGVIGMGSIGRRVARLAMAFDMEVVGHDPYVSYPPDDIPMVSLEELLGRSRFISVHCTLSDRTYHLLDERALKRVRPGAYLINTSRGAIVDETAALRALRDGVLAGIATDVYEAEPELSRSCLVGVPGVITTPHIAGHTRATYRRQSLAVVDAVRQLVAGQVPAGVLNPEAIPRWYERWKEAI